MMIAVVVGVSWRGFVFHFPSSQDPDTFLNALKSYKPEKVGDGIPGLELQSKMADSLAKKRVSERLQEGVMLAPGLEAPVSSHSSDALDFGFEHENGAAHGPQSRRD